MIDTAGLIFKLGGESLCRCENPGLPELSVSRQSPDIICRYLKAFSTRFREFLCFPDNLISAEIREPADIRGPSSVTRVYPDAHPFKGYTLKAYAPLRHLHTILVQHKRI